MKLPKPAGPPKPTRLKVTDERGFEKVVLIDKDVFPVGREAGGLELPDREPFAIAQRHALVIRDGDTFVLKDQSGPCGTRVNGRPIRSTVLKHGDQISLGTSSLRIQFLVEGTRASDFEEVRIRLLLEMLRELHARLEPSEICARAAAGIMGLTGSEWAAISLIGKDGGLAMVAGLDRSGSLPNDSSAIAQHVASSNRSYFHPARLCVAITGTMAATGEREAPRAGARPGQGSPLGVIDAGPRERGPYKADDMELLEALAAHVGVALSNSRQIESALSSESREAVAR